MLTPVLGVAIIAAGQNDDSGDKGKVTFVP